MSVGGILTMRKAMIDERPVEEIAVPAGIVAGVSFFATVAMGLMDDASPKRGSLEQIGAQMVRRARMRGLGTAVAAPGLALAVWGGSSFFTNAEEGKLVEAGAFQYSRRQSGTRDPAGVVGRY